MDNVKHVHFHIVRVRRRMGVLWHRAECELCDKPGGPLRLRKRKALADCEAMEAEHVS